MKRKVLSVLLTVTMAAAMLFTGCGGANSGTTEDSDAAGSDATTQADDTTAQGDDATEDTQAADAGSDTASTEKITIGYSVKTLSDTYMQFLKSGIDAQVAELGTIDLQVADAQMDLNTQLSQAEDFISKGVDVLLFCPQDADACTPIVEAAIAANIPIVEVCTNTNDGKYDAFVGSNDVDAGEMLGDFVMEKLPDGGNILIMEGIMGQSSQIFRYEGLQNTILADSKYNLLECKTANWQRDEAMALVEDWLVKYPEIDAIICENDDMAMGALEACEAANRKEDIIIIGVDGNQDNIQAVLDGRLEASILQNGPEQGSTAIDICVKLANGESVDKEYMIPFKLITQENAGEFLN